MPEAARTLAIFSAGFLLAATYIWAMFLRGPLLQRLDGGRASNKRPAQIAIEVLVVGLCFSAVAALIAVIGWIAA